MKPKYPTKHPAKWHRDLPGEITQRRKLMRNAKIRKFLTILLTVAMIAVMALSICGCSKGEENILPLKDGKTYGNGATSFTLVVTDLDQNTTTVTVKTDKTTVGDALLALGIIDGNPSDWGLYVTTVNGIVLDWDKDQAYWSFYIGSEYAQTGVDSTDIVAGTTYTLAAAKG